MNGSRGIVFHIIHGSFVDGFGIRTTVFLKGCPLRCLWCCNPEGQRGQLEIKFTSSACNDCGRCIEVCPVEAIQLEPEKENNRLRIDREACTNCGKCIEVCYAGALDYFGKYMTVDEVFETIKKDQQYYRASGGGVTIGGGEPTLQPDLTRALLKKCKDNYIHAALDTCGYTLTEEGFEVLEEAELLLFDLKGMDDGQHLINTGVSNELILKNLEKLGAQGKPIIIRVPVIPGRTDSESHINKLAEFLSRIRSVMRVDLLAYHQYGRVKYEQLGRKYDLDCESPSPEQLKNIMDIFKRYGLKVQLGG